MLLEVRSALAGSGFERVGVDMLHKEIEANLLHHNAEEFNDDQVCRRPVAVRFSIVVAACSILFPHLIECSPRMAGLRRRCCQGA